MSTSWIATSSRNLGKFGEFVSDLLSVLGRPANLRRLRLLILLLLMAWALASLSRLIWLMVPQPVQSAPDPANVLDVPQLAAPGPAAPRVDIDELTAWHLFGEAGAEAENSQAVQLASQSTNSREGIEKGARETRLQLKLTGIVAASEDGLGFAIIEYKQDQQVYAVEDELPVTGRVKLAKVMADRVVLDNGGTYELLTLFEQSELDKQLPEQLQVELGENELPPRPQVSGTTEVVDKRSDRGTRVLATNLRKRLYSDPQSLGDLVQVSAVREGSQLMGYRLSPGKNAAQFKRLGFEAGDIVVGINGVPLDSPKGAMQLYQNMREATEAVFDLRRQGKDLQLAISLNESE